MRPNPWWQEQFKGNLHIMMLVVLLAFFAAFGIADLLPMGRSRFMWFPLATSSLLWV
jgi:hypothetical protein